MSNKLVLSGTQSQVLLDSSFKPLGVCFPWQDLLQPDVFGMEKETLWPQMDKSRLELKEQLILQVSQGL